jgi:DNA repair exonuclease SbcCD nuclease subunit
MNDHGEYVLAHMSDLHLGYKAGRKNTPQGINWRVADGYKALHDCINEILEDGSVDAVLVSGDVFHVPEPDVNSIIIAQREFRRLARAGLPVYSIAGNHDKSDIRSEIAASAIIDDRDAGIWSHAEPYAVHEIFPNVWLHMVSHHLFVNQAATWEYVQPKPDAINIFTAHGTVMDPETRTIIHSEAPSPREIIIPSEIVNDDAWDVCMLGHIHERRYVGKPSSSKIFYNGSIIRRGFSDGVTSLGRGWTKWTIHADGKITPVFMKIAQRPQKDFDVIDAHDMSSADIGDVIIDNLKDGLAHTSSDIDSPILRQKVINISSEKKKSLDLPTISTLASKALTWTLQTQTIEETTKTEEQSSSGGSVSDRYSSWLESSDEYKILDKDMRKDVKTYTTNYIAKGQEEVLDEQ